MYSRRTVRAIPTCLYLKACELDFELRLIRGDQRPILPSIPSPGDAFIFPVLQPPQGELQHIPHSNNESTTNVVKNIHT